MQGTFVRIASHEGGKGIVCHPPIHRFQNLSAAFSQ